MEVGLNHFIKEVNMANKTTKKREGTSRSFELPSVKELLEAGVHFGHETKRWNPNYREYIYQKRGKFHIIDLEKTLEKLEEALKFLKESASKGEILIVGTKRQARDIVREEAIRSGALYVTNRWVGGQLTNFEKVQKSIDKLTKIEERLSGDLSKISQQRLSVLRREWGRLERLFGGIKKMKRIPSAIVLIDALYERIPLHEATVANVPVVALVDSNTNPLDLDYPIPGNDDAIRSIKLFVKMFADAILLGNKGKGVKHEFTDFSTIGVKDDKEKTVSEKKKVKKKSSVSKK